MVRQVTVERIERTNERTNKRTNGRTDGRTEGRTNERTVNILLSHVESNMINHKTISFIDTEN